MPENEEAKEAAGPTCLYKDGESETFEGADVAKALGEGWTDSPEKDQEPSTPMDKATEPKPSKTAPEVQSPK